MTIKSNTFNIPLSRGRHLQMEASSATFSRWRVSLARGQNFLPLIDQEFIEKWLKKEDQIPKKVKVRDYSSFFEGYIFDVSGKFELFAFVSWIIAFDSYKGSYSRYMILHILLYYIINYTRVENECFKSLVLFVNACKCTESVLS